MGKSRVKRDKYVGFRLPKVLYDWIQDKSAKELKTISEILNQLVKEDYDQHQEDEE